MSEQVASPYLPAPSASVDGVFLLWTLRPGGSIVIEVDGVLDTASTPRFADLLRARLDSTSPLLVMDLSRVSFLDTYGVVALTEAAHRAQLSGVDLVLVTGNQHVDRLLTLLDLVDRFTYADTVADALDRQTPRIRSVPVPTQATGSRDSLR